MELGMQAFPFELVGLTVPPSVGDLGSDIVLVNSEGLVGSTASSVTLVLGLVDSSDSFEEDSLFIEVSVGGDVAKVTE